VADVIEVQTPGNRGYFDRWRQQPGRKLEVLQNWLDKPAQARCPIRVSEPQLAGRKVFVYAGNMGVAQGMDILLDLAEKLRHRTVGRCQPHDFGSHHVLLVDQLGVWKDIFG